MSGQPSDFLDSARELLNSGNEIGYRNVNSRAYYAAYHLSVTKWDLKPPSGEDERGFGMHKLYILQRMKAPAGSLERRVGVKLQTAYGRRRTADYVLDVEVTKSEASRQVVLVSDIFRMITPDENNAELEEA
jgi:uncharacterized protein (UPF0332 family)